jgi:hypothetical protein
MVSIALNVIYLLVGFALDWLFGGKCDAKKR